MTVMIWVIPVVRLIPPTTMISLPSFENRMDNSSSIVHVYGGMIHEGFSHGEWGAASHRAYVELERKDNHRAKRKLHEKSSVTPISISTTHCQVIYHLCFKAIQHPKSSCPRTILLCHLTSLFNSSLLYLNLSG
jgi:hypothetical protein